MHDSCRICGSDDSCQWKPRSIDRKLRPEDLRITDSGYGATLALRKCRHCGFVFAEGEELTDLLRLYEELSDPEYEDTQHTRLLQMRWLLRMALKSRPGAATLLDVGAGTGLLVREAREMGLDAAGVEPSRSLVEAARVGNGVDLCHGTLPHPALVGRTFDLVFLVDVIEHVLDPLGLLRECKAMLHEKGRLVVVTPDIRSLAARLLGRRWWHFRLAHVGFFSRKSLHRAADAAGLVPTRWVRAKWFFPVRYLAERSERYLPVGWLNRLAARSRPLRWCYDRIVPLNLYDSFVVIMECAE